jgi:23S rRNA pseudouridine2605 synthase
MATRSSDKKRVGLARALSKLGYCSRSRAMELIREGRVALNGRKVRDPETRVQLTMDRIAVDGGVVEQAQLLYLVMNKPRGVVTTAADEKGRKTVYDLLPAGSAWVGPVGRLDKASEGLLLLSNDSEWAAEITDPASHLEKTYHVQVDCVADAELAARLTGDRRRGGGDKHDLRAKRVRLLRHGEKNSWLEITLDEGKNRQIRRLLESLGVGVLRLVRVAIGPIELGELKKGAVRAMSASEKGWLIGR